MFSQDPNECEDSCDIISNLMWYWIGVSALGLTMLWLGRTNCRAFQNTARVGNTFLFASTVCFQGSEMSWYNKFMIWHE